MKEASGELNMTAITVIAITAVAAFFYAFVWPSLKGNITNSQKCAAAVCEECNNGVASCSYTDTTNGSNNVITINCPCKN